MKNKILKTSILSVILFILLNFNPLQAQLRFKYCDTCTYKVAAEFNHKDIRKAILLDTNGNRIIDYYEGCTDSAAKKLIYWTHGLAGSASSWQNALDWTDSNYKVGNANPVYSGYEFNFNQVAEKYSDELLVKETKFNQVYPTRCKSSDFVIAHSQGGLAARYLDYKWETDVNGNFGVRKFNGIVTFGTPNAGANISLSINEHRFYVQKLISTIVISGVKERAYNLTDRFGWIIGSSLLNALTQLDTFIAKTVAPMGLSSLHTGTMLQMAPKSSVINALTSFKSDVHRVAFVGEENAPENWRIFDEFLHKKASTYPTFKADNDSTTKKKMEEIRANHEKEIITLNEGIKNLKTGRFWTLGIFNTNKISDLTYIKDRRYDAVEWLNNSTEEWRYLIGSYHKDSFYKNKFDTTFTLTFSIIPNNYRHPPIHIKKIGFKTQQFALDYFNNYPFPTQAKINRVITKELGKIRMFFPSDGAILCKSQIAFPDVKLKDTDKMPLTNHMQMRNCAETKIKLLNLYKGVKHDKFFKTLEK